MLASPNELLQRTWRLQNIALTYISNYYQGINCQNVARRREIGTWSTVNAAFIGMSQNQNQKSQSQLTKQHNEPMRARSKSTFRSPSVKRESLMEHNQTSLAFKRSLLKYYTNAVNIFDQEDIRTWRTIWPKCNAARNLTRPPYCCF